MADFRHGGGRRGLLYGGVVVVAEGSQNRCGTYVGLGNFARTLGK
jgi:hypothetical protein